MTDSGARDWPPGLSDLRLACEECHKRKVRCEAPQDESSQGACQACRANRRTCLFSLKSKTGRPRKTSKQSSSSQLHPTFRPVSPASLHGQFEFRHDSMTEQHDISSNMAVNETPSDTYLGRPSWLPAINVATERNGLDALLDNQPGSGVLSPSPGLDQLTDDFFMNIVATHGPAFSGSTPSLNGQHELWQREHDQQDPSTLWTTVTSPSSGEQSDRSGSSRDESRRSDTNPPSRHNNTKPTPSRNSNSTRGSGVLSNYNPSGTTDPKPDTPRPVSGDLFDAMRLCGEMNSRYQSKLLDVMAQADERELAIVFGNIEELGHKTAAAMRDAGSGSSTRQDQYKWMLTRVAVMGAVDIAADFVKHNLSMHKIKLPIVSASSQFEGVDIEDGYAPLRGGHGDDPLSKGRMPVDMLESVLSLARLDYALLQFSRFLSTDECDPDGCPDPSKGVGMSRPGGHGCPKRRTSTLTRLTQIRAQVWALAEGIRKLW